MGEIRRRNDWRTGMMGASLLAVSLVTACGSASDAKVRSVVVTSTTRRQPTTTSSTTSTSTTTTAPPKTAAPTTAPAVTPPTPSVRIEAPPPPPPPTPQQYQPPAPAVGGWTTLNANGGGIASQSVVDTGGTQIIVVRVGASARLNLIAGTDDGGPGRIPPEQLGNTVIAFNGAFKIGEAGKTGMFDNGHSKGQFESGMAAVVGYRNGTFALGAVGRDVPFPDSDPNVLFARSNLYPIVDGGAITGGIDDLGAWGAPLFGYTTGRSSLGIDAGGNLLVAVCGQCVPRDLASALVAPGVGAVRAMELDINPWWIELSSFSGTSWSRLYNNTNRSDNPFVSGWSRDFFTVTVN